MSKRAKKPAKQRQEHSLAFIVTTWVGSVLSLLLLWAAGNAFASDIGSLRSCNANNAGLSVSSCGKQSLNPGDLVIFVLFTLSACLTVTLFTAAWRLSRRSAG